MLVKIWNIIVKVIFVGLVLFVLLCCTYWFFHSVPIDKTPINVELTAYKLDKYGNTIDTFPITIEGHIEKYLFQDDRINANISPFDGYTDFCEHNLNDERGGIFYYTDTLGYTNYFATGDDGYEYFAIYFTEGFEQVAIHVRAYREDDPFYTSARYVASVNESDSIEDIIKYCGHWLDLE